MTAPTIPPQPVYSPPMEFDATAVASWTLVQRVQAGQPDAFAELYERYRDTVFRYVLFRVGTRHVAEDISQDVWVRAMKSIGGFTWQGRDVGAWLVTIARNLIADHFKSGRYRLEMVTGDVFDVDRADNGPEGRPEDTVLDGLTSAELLAAIRKLQPDQRECITLRFLHGFSVAETAEAMYRNEGAVKALQYRAVRALARALPDGFDGRGPVATDIKLARERGGERRCS